MRDTINPQWATAIACCLFLLNPNRADCLAEAPSDSEPPSLRAEIAALRDEVRGLRRAVKELGERVAPDFAPVKVLVQTPSGAPLAGCAVSMFRGSKETRISVKGTTAADGVALKRRLPYGEYSISVKTPDGFFTYIRKQMVEIGKGLDLTVVAPEPDQWGVLRLHTALDPSKLTGLRFGEYRQRSRGSSSWSIRYSPEPNGKDDTFWNFPTLEEGIKRIAIEISTRIARKVDQPDGGSMTFQWTAPEGHPLRALSWVLVDSFARRSIKGSTADKPVARGPYFQKLRLIEGIQADEREREIDYEIGYLVQTINPVGQSPFTVKLPAGEVEVSLEQIYGEASVDVVESIQLGKRPEAGQTVWLEANLRRDSAWYDRLVNREAWKAASADETIRFFGKQELTLEAGKETTLRIASP